MRQHQDGDVLPGWEPGDVYVVGEHTDESAVDHVCAYDDAAYEIAGVVHGWAKSQPVRDDYGEVVSGFTFHGAPVRGGWRCSLVTLAPGQDRRTVDRYVHCHHRSYGGHCHNHDWHAWAVSVRQRDVMVTG